MGSIPGRDPAQAAVQEAAKALHHIRTSMPNRQDELTEMIDTAHSGRSSPLLTLDQADDIGRAVNQHRDQAMLARDQLATLAQSLDGTAAGEVARAAHRASEQLAHQLDAARTDLYRLRSQQPSSVGVTARAITGGARIRANLATAGTQAARARETLELTLQMSRRSPSVKTSIAEARAAISTAPTKPDQAAVTRSHPPGATPGPAR